MRRGLVAVALLPALAGCFRARAPEPPAGEWSGGAALASESTPEPESASGLAVTSLEAGSAFDFRAGKLGSVARQFAQETPVVYVVARVREAHGTVEGRWVHLDSDTHLGSAKVELEGPEAEARFSLSKPTAGWPEGRYKFYLAVNGEDVAGLEFSVAESQSAGGPPSAAGSARERP